MDIKEFTEKMKEKGYEVNHIPNDALIVSRENYYHVSLHEKLVFNSPFDYLLGFVEKEISRLRASE